MNVSHPILRIAADNELPQCAQTRLRSIVRDIKRVIIHAATMYMCWRTDNEKHSLIPKVPTMGNSNTPNHAMPTEVNHVNVLRKSAVN